ncbi:MAG TPA: tetratricopeptide repeat protein, partial [Candidatus Saccharimonadales bacterium]|nr:tetratricopeptide repeat protein [Candidatus Saccharimonadales bacterium]
MKWLLRSGLVLVGLAAVYSMALAGPMYTSLKLYVGQKNWERAVKVGPRAIEEDPEKPDIYNKFGIALAELDSIQQAGEMFEKGLQLARAQKDADAEKEVESGRDHYYAHYFNQGLASLNGGNDVVDSLGRKADTTSLAVKAALQVAASKFDKALTSFERAVWLKPDDAKSWSQKGLALTYLHRSGEAMACFHKALEIDPAYKNARENLKNSMIEAAEGYKSQGNWPEAAKVFEELFGLGDSASLLDLGDCYFNEGKATKDSVAKFEKLRKSSGYYGQYAT